MVSFTAYANKKFGILERHGCVIPRNIVRDAVLGGAMSAASADASAEKTLFFAQKQWESGRAVRVAYKKEAGAARIITFYPVTDNA